jgi:hypothetical protein
MLVVRLLEWEWWLWRQADVVRSKVCGRTGLFATFHSPSFRWPAPGHPTIYLMTRNARLRQGRKCFMSSDWVVALGETRLVDFDDMISLHRYAHYGLQVVFHTRFVVITLNIRLF